MAEDIDWGAPRRRRRGPAAVADVPAAVAAVPAAVAIVPAAVPAAVPVAVVPLPPLAALARNGR